MEEGRSAYKILATKPTEKRPLGRPRHRWEDNIRIDLKEMVINTRNCCPCECGIEALSFISYGNSQLQ
jgi:hypothetical protein